MKYLYLLLILSVLSRVCMGQDLDIKPGQQAQGILESKNAMIDHTTGLFHYKVPLYEVKSGSLSIPVTLNYVAKGVKVDDRPGLLGYNWTLNTGGVVTRTVRGGIPDETWQYGYLYHTISSTPTKAQIDSVNKNLIDGEADIFTASFNGQTVHFIIKKENKGFIAVPLERTNVKIEVSHSMGNLSDIFDEWIITDEQGTKYTFAQKEWITNVNREGIVGTNSLMAKNYISSWYLNKVEPIDGYPIIYSYLEDVKEFGSQSGVNRINKYNSSKSLYIYGKKVVDYPFDYNKYDAAIQEQLSEAAGHLKDYNVSLQVNNSLTMLRNDLWIPNPDFTTNIQIQNDNTKIIGMLHDFSRVANASNQTMNVVNDLINRYKNSSSVDVQLAVSNFRAIKSIVKTCLTERTEIDRKELYTNNTISVKTPVLTSIQYCNKFLFFEYNRTVLQNDCVEYLLQRIKYSDLSKSVINSVLFTLNRISCRDKNDTEYDYVTFESYNSDDCPDYKFNAVDAWGYPNMEGAPQKLPNSNCARYGSLKRIKTSGGGEIELKYESNVISYSNLVYPNGKYGGIRIKSVIVNESDTINYKYPNAGTSIYEFTNDEEIVAYPGFQDKIISDRVVNKGKVYFDSGNNGLYYQYVLEEFVDKGTKAYLFNVINGIVLERSFAFWLYGLPLGTATYDVNNKLVSLSKLSYHYDYGDGYPTNVPIEIVYSSALPQIKAYSYYMDKQRLEEEYRDQKNILLYSDEGTNRYLNVYNDIYVPNIQPRTTLDILPKQAYTLFYGGKVLLKEKQDYKFENSIPKIPEISDFNIDNLTPVSTTKYMYDNLLHSVYPTRIIRTNSAGDEFVENIKRAAEIADNSDPVIPLLKSKNIYATVLSSSQQYKPYNGSQYKLLEDNVFKYANKTVEDKESIVLDKIYSNKPADLWNMSNEFTNSPLFVRPLSEYIQTSEFGYNKSPYFATQNKELAGVKSVNYDFVTGNKIFSCNNYEYTATASMNFKTSYREMGLDGCRFISGEVKKFYDMYLTLNFDKCDQSFKDYLASEEYIKLMHIVKSFVTGKDMLEYGEFELFSKQAPKIVENFWGAHDSQLYFISPAGVLTYSKLNEIRNLLYNRVFTMPRITYENMYVMQMPYAIPDKEMSITQIQPDKNYKLYVVSEGKDYGQFSFDYKIDSQSKSVYIPGTAYTKLSVFDINLSAYSNISKMSIGLPSYTDCIFYVAIVPANAEFEAISYNTDGTIFCKFNQIGQMERYEYDTAGRPIRIFDQNGNLLKEIKYNKILN